MAKYYSADECQDIEQYAHHFARRKNHASCGIYSIALLKRNRYFSACYMRAFSTAPYPTIEFAGCHKKPEDKDPFAIESMRLRFDPTEHALAILLRPDPYNSWHFLGLELKSFTVGLGISDLS